MKSLNLNIFEAADSQLSPRKGRILIAEPFLEEPFFKRSIVYLTDFNKNGAVGLVLNKSSEIYPDEIIDDLFNFKGKLFIGGPVDANTLHFIHTLGNKISGSVQVSESIWWGGDFEQIKKLIKQWEFRK